ncbi:MAG: nitroreductase family protein [Planctomycetaceae bacterium]|nr:nitroreductase family protein [Planctomycetaceae bacterium]
MDLLQAIAQRHSYRGKFTDTAVSRDDLRMIAQAGLDAPSACNGQVASLVVVDDVPLVREIAAIVDKPVCWTAKAMIVCAVDPRPVFADLSFAAEDCAAAVENMLLTITSLGYASVWLDGVLRREHRAARIAKLLGIPDRLTVRVLLPIGVPAEPVSGIEKLAFDRRAWFNRYGGEG